MVKFFLAIVALVIILIIFQNSKKNKDGKKSDIYKILKPGGVLITICHNERHFLSKLLRNKHPIINDEHNYVFSPNTLKKI